jgi:hypothetical protein
MKKNQWIKLAKRLGKVICGSIIAGIPTAIACTSIAMPTARINPHLSLFSQAPANPNTIGNPQGTPPTPIPATPPLPEQQQPPSAKVVPVEGRVNVTLVNQTYTNVTYQVIGDTQPRTLAGRADITLQNLKTPVNITFQRPDRGLLRVSPQPTEPGLLQVNLTETTDLSTDRTAMTIQVNGNVILN